MKIPVFEIKIGDRFYYQKDEYSTKYYYHLTDRDYKYTYFSSIDNHRTSRDNEPMKEIYGTVITEAEWFQIVMEG